MLFIIAMRHVGTARAGAYFSIAPFFGAVLAVALGDPITIPLLVAGLLMALGVWLHITERHEHEHTHPPVMHDHAHRHDDGHHDHVHVSPVAAGPFTPTRTVTTSTPTPMGTTRTRTTATRTECVADSFSMTTAVTYIGGPTILLEYAGLMIVTDPTFDAPQSYSDGDGSPPLVKTAGPGIQRTDLPRVDIVLLSHHEHEDNLDYEGLELLATGVRTYSTMKAAGDLFGGAVHGLDPWESDEFQGVTVTAVPALHGPPGSERRLGPVIGFVLEAAGEPTVYVSGDNASIPLVEQIAERFPTSASRCCSQVRRSTATCRGLSPSRPRMRRVPPASWVPRRGRRAYRGLGAFQREPRRPRGRVRGASSYAADRNAPRTARRAVATRPRRGCRRRGRRAPSP